MAENEGIPPHFLDVVQQCVVQLGEHGADNMLIFAVDPLVLINLAVIFPLRSAEIAEGGLAHEQIIAAVAVLDYVNAEVVDDGGVFGADLFVGEGAIGVDDVSGAGVLTVLADVSDHIANADHTALESGGNKVAYGRLIHVAGLGLGVKSLEGLAGDGAVFLHLKLAVVAENAVQGLEGEIAGIYSVQHSGGVDVVIEIAAGLILKQLGEKALACVTEGGVPNVVA